MRHRGVLCGGGSCSIQNIIDDEEEANLSLYKTTILALDISFLAYV